MTKARNSEKDIASEALSSEEVLEGSGLHILI